MPVYGNARSLVTFVRFLLINAIAQTIWKLLVNKFFSLLKIKNQKGFIYDTT